MLPLSAVAESTYWTRGSGPARRTLTRALQQEIHHRDLSRTFGQSRVGRLDASFVERLWEHLCLLACIGHHHPALMQEEVLLGAFFERVGKPVELWLTQRISNP